MSARLVLCTKREDNDVEDIQTTKYHVSESGLEHWEPLKKTMRRPKELKGLGETTEEKSKLVHLLHQLLTPSPSEEQEARAAQGANRTTKHQHKWYMNQDR